MKAELKVRLENKKSQKRAGNEVIKIGFPNEFVSENTGLSKQNIGLKDSID
ncbi:hypothetical protein OCHUTO_1111 [Orientia chuto str. Dubai]|uniref:Uncharacterized protein n=1 Tax=Orientia chuto str. Dubai TaxID=1359168 RepID=A0A0F3MFV7_9RICK|nr:hypothetical protein [Candidatus Orientia mediorientalis]KJV54638.1 hypothetical protein OCHUTO_1111 [Orientia chuto str. Dubai]